jgi:hypothetical protein
MQKLVAPSRAFSFFLFFFGNGDEVEKAKMFTDAFDHVFFFIIQISLLRLWTATKLFISRDYNFSGSLNQV